MKEFLYVTEKAKSHIINILNSANKLYLEISVLGKGCNGLSYNFDMIDVDFVDVLDEIVKLDDTHSIVVPNSSIMFLLGSVVEYESTIFQSRLVISNPHATSKCGCGNSFGV